MRRDGSLGSPASAAHNGGVSQTSVTGQRRGDQRSIGGIVGALIAVIGLIAAVWALSWFQHRAVPNPARTVDYRPALAVARAQSPFRVLAPEPAPRGMRATSVSWDGGGAQKSWQLGFVTDGGDFVGLYEGNGPAADFIDASTPAGTPGPPVSIGGVAWITLTDAGRGETALVRTNSGVTTVVTGTATQAALVSFARALR